MANPSGNHQEAASHGSSSFNGTNPSNGNSTPVDASGGMKHNPGISLDWTSEEQSILDEGLANFATEATLVRYAKIAMQLENKTVRDVALRCRWNTKKEISKRRKEEHNLARKSKDKKERVVDTAAKSPHFTTRPNVAPYAPLIQSMDNDDGISYKAIGGATGELLEQNAQALNRISVNLQAFQIQDNISLFCQARDNIVKIMNDLNDMPDVMKQMPPLPVKVNEELMPQLPVKVDEDLIEHVHPPPADQSNAMQ